VSIGAGLVAALILLAISRTAIVALIGLAAGGCAPYAYWSSHRRQVTAARATAWPDALRCVIGALSSGTSTLHASLVDLAESGPQPLRPPMARYARRSGQIGSLSALEAVRAEMADPVSDQVLLTFAQAASEGTQTVLRTLELLLEQTNGDIALQDRVRTAGTQLRLASWTGFFAPLFVLVLFCTVSPQYRQFFSHAVGIVLVIVGTTLDGLGLMVTRRLARTVPTTRRIFTEAVNA
jgi:Flp pilus assembly protein TadB